MNRKEFLKAAALLPLAGTIMKLPELDKLSELETLSEKMPAMFIGHGSPMNAIELNEFSKTWQTLGKELVKPKAILCVSAHWETRGTFVTAMDKPQTIHDFGGFPQELFNVQYPAPGSPAFAKTTKETITSTTVGLDEKWGLDHGSWSILKHLYPAADVPVLQLSIDYTKDAQHHYDLAKQLKSLRSKGVLIIGSGNMVHNLGMVAWDKMNQPDYGYDWALEAREKMNKFILNNNHQELINFKKQGKAFDLSIPTPEHYLPLIYTLALQDKDEKVSLFNDKALMGSLTMTSVKIG
ncbi:MAG TPA: 4,5-DOPA dioxygenase extradiol [Bacteroidia bacterium]